MYISYYQYPSHEKVHELVVPRLSVQVQHVPLSTRPISPQSAKRLNQQLPSEFGYFGAGYCRYIHWPNHAIQSQTRWMSPFGTGSASISVTLSTSSSPLYKSIRSTGKQIGVRLTTLWPIYITKKIGIEIYEVRKLDAVKFPGKKQENPLASSNTVIKKRVKYVPYGCRGLLKGKSLWTPWSMAALRNL